MARFYRTWVAMAKPATERSGGADLRGGRVQARDAAMAQQVEKEAAAAAAPAEGVP
jgi:hypothetical protein